MKIKIIVIIVALSVSFATGRYTAPVKIIKEVEIKTVEVVREVEKKTSNTDTQRNKRKETITTETTYPDGRKVVETRVVETTDTDRKSSTDSDTITDTERQSESKSKETVENRSPGWAVHGLIGVQVSDWQKGPDLGAHITKEILGPVSAGAFGLRSGLVGVSLGLTF